jgi:uncharacterized protein
MIAAPVRAGERIGALDAVRGFALLGILVPNLLAFGWPSATMFDAAAVMGDTAWTRRGMFVHDVFFLGKMMFLFAMLFGAGVMLYARKFDREGSDGRPAPLSAGSGLWYRRCAVLLGFGLVHAFGLWYGDILVSYALAGMALVWWVRRLPTGALIGLGAGLIVLGATCLSGFMGMGLWAQSQGKFSFMDGVEAEIAAYRGGYLDAFGARFGELIMMYLGYLPLYFPAITGLMLIGMGLFKSGWLAGTKPARAYLVAALVCLPVGWGLSVAARAGLRAVVPDSPQALWMVLAQPIGAPISFGYAALVIWLVKVGALRPVTAGLAAVGRMAFSNYLLQTLLCTTLFYGYGFGLFATIDFPGLFGVAAGVWAVNIAFSVIWLRFFSIGPAEWVWRALTYGTFPAWRGGRGAE